MSLFRYRKDIPLAGCLFLFALGIYTIHGVVSLSCLNEIIPATILRLMNAAVAGVLFIKLLAGERFSVRKLVIWVLLLGLSLLLQYLHGYSDLFVMLLIMLAAEGVDFEDILRTLLIAMGISTILIVLFSLVGILPDYIYPHGASFVTQQAHSLGFRYYSSLGYNMMMLTLFYLLLEHNCGFLKLGGLVAVNLGMYLVHTTGLAFAVAILFIIWYTVSHILLLKKSLSPKWEMVASLVPWILFVLTVGLVLLYSFNLISSESRLLSTLMSRLKYSYIAFVRFGVHLFGTKLIVYGNTAKFYGVSTSSFYIDSGYIYSLVAYGVVFTVLVLVLYSVLCRYVWVTCDLFLVGTLFLFLGMCIVNNFLLDPLYNPVLFLMPCAIRAWKTPARLSHIKILQPRFLRRR